MNCYRWVGFFLLAGVLAGPALADEPPDVRAETKVPFSPPAADSMPKGPMGDAVRLGEDIVTHTRQRLKGYVGAGLNCVSCHPNGGRTANAIPFVGLWGVYPAYRSRNARVDTLSERINGCMQRSMNGKPLPLDSEEMIAMLSYIAWLSQGVPAGAEVEGRGLRPVKAPAAPNAGRGKAVYAKQCVACHGADGGGTKGADGVYLFPPLWGPKSFNVGAGMARLDTAAAFFRAEMPFGHPGLSDQDAYDVALYVTTQPRPDFPGKIHDWPKGGRPSDARY